MIPAEAVEAAARWWHCIRRGHMWTTRHAGLRYCARCSKGIQKNERTSR